MEISYMDERVTSKSIFFPQVSCFLSYGWIQWKNFYNFTTSVKSIKSWILPYFGYARAFQIKEEKSLLRKWVVL